MFFSSQREFFLPTVFSRTGYKLRILHIIATLDHRAGGPSNSIRRIVSTYPGIGCEGEVLTLDDPDAPFLDDAEFPVHALGPVGSRYGFNSRLIPWLRAHRDRFDGVVIHGLWQYLGWAVRRAIHPHKPYLVFTHGMLDPYFRRAYPFKHIKKFTYWLCNEYWVLNNAHRVLFTSDAEARHATASFWPSNWNASVIPYGASAPQGDPDALRQAFLNRYPALRRPDGRTRRFILFLGRIHSKKGCDLLLDAFTRIAASTPDLDLVFAGPENSGGTDRSPGLKARLINQAAVRGFAHRVHWTGMLYGDQKWGAFFASEAFCLPSHQENFGIAVAEALACGRPVLISDKVNIWQEIVRDGAAFVAPDTGAGTLRLLEDWIALTPAQRITMGARALDCFHRRYDMQASARGIIDIFSRAVSTPAAAPAILPKAKARAL
jgi:glycosyltransferase involved in cell wall biosynthesis